MSEILKRSPLPGIEVWHNPKNKFLVFQLHYSANAAKCDPAYRAEVKSGMPLAQYNQEYEIQWDSYAGKPVYGDFNSQVHKTLGKIVPELGLPLLRGWDFGLTPACVVAQLVGRQLRVIKEYTEVNMGAERFCAKVMPLIATQFPKFSGQDAWIDFMDPSGAFRKDTDESTCADILAKATGHGALPGPVAWEARRTAVERFLTSINGKEGPGFLIDANGCPVLLRGFEGGYRYAEKAFDIEPNKVRPLKDEHSHPHDALQYICSMVTKLRHKKPASVPRMGYSFTGSQGPQGRKT